MEKATIFKLVFAFLAVSFAALGFLGYSELKSNNPGEVLGASTNYYKDKNVQLVIPPAKKSNTPDPAIYADVAVLVYDNGKYPLYEKKSHAQVPIASITKLMTALVSRDLYKADDVIEIVQDNTRVEGSVIGLVPGEKIAFENVLHGLLMNSGNDAAKTLATSKTTEEEFVKRMNEKAGSFGLKETYFLDSAGLNDQSRSSAYDISVIFSMVLEDELLSKIITTVEKDVSSVDGATVHKLKNSNRLITGEIPMEGVIGGKTGFTYEAGHTLVAAAKVDNHILISVILKTFSNSPSASAEEAKKLLAWGFNSFSF